MPNPIEGEHRERVVDGQTFDVWPWIWPDGAQSWEVQDVAADALLTMDGSFDSEPTDEEIRRAASAYTV